MGHANLQLSPDSVREYPSSRRRLTAMAAFVRGLGDKASATEIARRAISTLGEVEGWNAGAVWLIGSHDPQPRCTSVWSAGERQVIDPSQPSVLLPRALATGRVVYASDDDLRRDPRCVREGFRAAMVVPIPGGKGALELFARTQRDPDPLSDDLWAAAAAAVGSAARADALERQAARVEQRLESVAGHAPIVLFAFDREGKLTLRSGRGLEHARERPSADTSLFELYRDAPAVLESLRRALAGEAFTCELSVQARGEMRHYETRYNPVFDAHGRVSEVIGVAIDVTERRAARAALERSQAQLIEADRLAALGTLAAGVAHEINNPLSYVLLNLDLMIREGGGGPELAARLAEARAGVERVRLIVQDLKSFSRSDTERRRAVDVRRVLDSTLEIAANEIRHRARLMRDYQEVPEVFADPSRLGQVFLNLIVNAAQSIDHEGEASQNEIRVRVSYDAGRVVVVVADTGSGIAPDHLPSIFDPFFTTKPPGEGTGLGLSICRDIVTALGGEISVESRLGHGTTFRVSLPAATVPWIDARPSPLPARPERRGRVLVIDDEPALGAALARSLDRDYEVIVRDSAREARELLRRDTAFDAILCDLIMPQWSGIDLHEDLSREHPTLAERMIFMTGGTFSQRAREFLAKVPNPALDKPFDLSTLSALLRLRMR